MSNKLRWREKFIWWHRVKGHRVIRGFRLLHPVTVYRCEDCNMIWERSFL